MQDLRTCAVDGQKERRTSREYWAIRPEFLQASVVQLLSPMNSVVVPTNLERLTERIIGCAIAVHKALGPGLLESVYRECLCIELQFAGLGFTSEQPVPIVYRDCRIRTLLRVDLMVEDLVIVEIKSVDALHPIHKAQVVTYLKLTGRPAGLLMNFNSVVLKDGLHRQNHPDVHARRSPCGAPRNRA